jgi:Fe2+ transport system protein FeoA
MDKGIIVRIEGENAVDAARVLTVRLLEMGRNAEHFDAAKAACFGTLKSAAFACNLLARNGVVVILTCPKLKLGRDVMEVELDSNDTPDYAVEKILDDLVAVSVIFPEDSGCTPEDEERIRKRLSDLGYIE